MIQGEVKGNVLTLPADQFLGMRFWMRKDKVIPMNTVEDALRDSQHSAEVRYRRRFLWWLRDWTAFPKVVVFADEDACLVMIKPWT